jgi:hypothetical protein
MFVGQFEGTAQGINRLSRRIKRLKKDLDVLCTTFSEHLIKPGEEAIQKELVDTCTALSGLYGRWDSTIEAFDDLEPFVPLKDDGLALAKKAGGADRFRRCFALKEHKPSGPAVPLATARYVNTVCPDGRWALGGSGSIACLCHNPDDVTSRGDPSAPTPPGKCEVVGSDGSNCKWKCE